jgi:sortase B
MKKHSQILLAAASASLSYAFCDLGSWMMGIHHGKEAVNEAAEIIRQPAAAKTSLKEMNADYVCWLEMEDQSVSLPVVQGRDDLYYLAHAFDLSESELGTPFFSAAAAMEDPVRIIYGHHISYDAAAMFTPLMKLEDHVGAENNTFILKYDEHREQYLITHVFRMRKNSDALDLRKKRFSSAEDFAQWILYADENNEIGPAPVCTERDHYVLLQTCTDCRDSFLVVIGKKIDI